jgi:septum site-determining protein MinC
MQMSLAIKGTRNGLLLTLEPTTDFDELLVSLQEKLDAAPAFFKGAALAVNATQRSMIPEERQRLEILLDKYQMVYLPLQYLDTSRQQRRPDVTLQSVSALSFIQQERADTLFLHRTIRSGQAIQHYTNIVIIGDVNAGAEIVAGGDVLVWGALRGMVHAGYPNSSRSVVAGLHLAPLQLRIAHLLSRSPEETQNIVKPEIAFIRDEHIFVEAWNNGSMRSKK